MNRSLSLHSLHFKCMSCPPWSPTTMCPPTPHPTTTTPTMLPTTFPFTTMQRLSTMSLSLSTTLSQFITQQSARMCLPPSAAPTLLSSHPIISLTMQQPTLLSTQWLTLWCTAQASTQSTSHPSTCPTEEPSQPSSTWEERRLTTAQRVKDWSWLRLLPSLPPSLHQRQAPLRQAPAPTPPSRQVHQRHPLAIPSPLTNLARWRSYWQWPWKGWRWCSTWKRSSSEPRRANFAVVSLCSGCTLMSIVVWIFTISSPFSTNSMQ